MKLTDKLINNPIYEILKKSPFIRAIPYTAFLFLPSIGYANYVKHFTNQNYIDQSYKIKSSDSIRPKFSNSDITEKLCGKSEEKFKDVACDVLETKNNNLVYRLFTSRISRNITEIREYNSKTNNPIRNIPIYMKNNLDENKKNLVGEVGFFSINNSGKIDYVRGLSKEEIY